MQTTPKCKFNIIFALPNNIIMDNLPQDITILFSYINTKLRDDYSSLDALCEDLNIDKQWLLDRLAQGGWEYNAELNKFW